MDHDAFQLDTTRWPIVIMHLRGKLTDADFGAMLDAWEVVVARKKRYVGINDMREMTAAANASQRRMIADRIRVMEQRYGQVAVRNIMIVNSPLLRGALTAIEWLRRQEKPDIWVLSMNEALAHAQAIVEQEGLVARQKVGNQ